MKNYNNPEKLHCDLTSLILVLGVVCCYETFLRYFLVVNTWMEENSLL